MAKSTPNPTSSILWFMLLTTLYSIVEYSTGKGDPNVDVKDNVKNSSSGRNFFIYMLLVFISEYFVNLGLTNTLCGSNQIPTAMLVTVLPWCVIFGIMVLLLSLFPGWLSPFSNTFGYAVALMAGLNDTMADILSSNPTGTKLGESNEQMQQALSHIYSDQSLLVNEITVDNFNYFWNNMKGVFRPGVANSLALKNQLYNMVRLKDIVATYIWYMLGGLLITSVSYNYIINTSCSISAAEIQSRHEEYEKELTDAQETAKNNKDSQRIYTSSE